VITLSFSWGCSSIGFPVRRAVVSVVSCLEAYDRQQWALEPIARLRNHLVRANAWGKEQEDRLLKECAEAINQAVEDYLATPAPATEAMFDHLYAQLPDAMREQRSTALRFAPTTGERDG
jgi:2-oxoisovalerate dehydrogenase E1 component alpha subunit